MRNEFSRSQILLGASSMEKLKNSRVAVFGLGGVGSFAAEALVRTGVGHLLFIDNDVVSPVSYTHLKGKPCVIIAKTVKGKGVSFMENQVGWHGTAPNQEQYEVAMQDLKQALAALEVE